MNSFTNKKVAVLGYGVEGKSVVNFLKKEGAVVTVFDEKANTEGLEGLDGIEVKNGAFPDLIRFDCIFRSPGIRPDTPTLVAAREKGVEVTSAVRYFFDHCPAPIIGITGTKGKGTTSSLIYEMLRKEKTSVFFGGNIGTPPLDFLHEVTKDSFVVLELSSFQLMDCTKSPHIGVLLMTVPEHQDWHTSVDEYLEAKSNLFSHQTREDFVVINTDYPLNRKLFQNMPGRILTVSMIPNDHAGCFVSDNNHLIYQHDGKQHDIIDTKDIKIPGNHNWENACAAVCVAEIVGVKPATIRSILKTFPGLPHRLEPIGTIQGVSYYNDSFSTTPETAIAAIKAFSQPKIVILGGSSKNSDFTELGKVISESTSIRGIVGIGKEWEQIKEKIQVAGSTIQVIEGCKDMKEIVEAAAGMAKEGDVVLLSPACASFDMFKNYKERGNLFREFVKKLS